MHVITLTQSQKDSGSKSYSGSNKSKFSPNTRSCYTFSKLSENFSGDSRLHNRCSLLRMTPFSSSNYIAELTGLIFIKFILLIMSGLKVTGISYDCGLS